MKKNNYWNDAAKYGAIVGVMLAVSNVLENSIYFTSNFTFVYLLLFEFFAVVVVHYFLLHRFTRTRSLLYTAGEGFTFGQAYGFLLAVSGFAGIILGVVQAVYLHLIVGYSNYVDHYVSWVTNLFSKMGPAAGSVEGLLSQIIEQLQSSSEPSLLATIWGGFVSSVVFGVFFGLIIAGVLSRAPRPFGTEDNE